MTLSGLALNAFANTVIPHLKMAFQVGHDEHDHFRFVEMEFATIKGVEMQQDTYIQNIQAILMDC